MKVSSNYNILKLMEISRWDKPQKIKGYIWWKAVHCNLVSCTMILICNTCINKIQCAHCLCQTMVLFQLEQIQMFSICEKNNLPPQMIHCSNSIRVDIQRIISGRFHRSKLRIIFGAKIMNTCNRKIANATLIFTINWPDNWRIRSTTMATVSKLSNVAKSCDQIQSLHWLAA